VLPTLVGVLGIAGAYVFYIQRPDLPNWFATRFRTIYLFF